MVNIPPWVNDIASICSIIGLCISIYLLFAIKFIKKSFLRRARLPDVIKELTSVNKGLYNNLKDWENESLHGIEKLKISIGLLENLKPKLPVTEKKLVSQYLKKVKPTKYLFFANKINNLESEAAWDLYSDLSGLITSLDQLKEDSRWD